MTAIALDATTGIETFTTTIERGRLLFFASVIGETDPLYTDLDAARAAGYPDLLVPPTFLFGLELDRPNPFAFLTGAGLDLSQVLHGEQEFRYHAPAFAGDTVAFSHQVTDNYTKKGGSLQFVVRETDVHRDGQLIAEMSQMIVARRGDMQ